VPAIWVLFFGTNVYGHVALKVAVDRAGRTPLSAFGAALGWTACLAWGASCVLWALALARQPLSQANALSSLRHLLTCLAAWYLLGEGLSPRQAAGIVLITVGVLLVK
jgi:drug/metabolite transporter (DMT)-like permease